MVDDTYYITPHEAALAAVATSMKKARLSLLTLTVNSFLGGLFFCSGSILYLSFHSTDPDTWNQYNAFEITIASTSYAVGLFYVVIFGIDLFNSNILYFSIGLLRGAVNVLDVLISWWVSLLGNILGCLFMSYVLVHLSGISKQQSWIIGSALIGEDKASYSFIETFIKGIAGNIFVCTAIYLQLLAKPIHVKFLMLILPVFTFVTIGFTHTVADMGVMFTAMLCGANVSVGEYIWKLLIPATLGNIVGGFAFTLLIPFYLHLVVVEQDRKKLSLPNYEARDEQPELNMDSRVVRISSREQMEYDNDKVSDNPNLTDGDSINSGATTTTSYNNEKLDYDSTSNINYRQHSRNRGNSIDSNDNNSGSNRSINISSSNTIDNNRINNTIPSPRTRSSSISTIAASLHSNTNSESGSLHSFNPSYIFDANNDTNEHIKNHHINVNNDPSRILRRYSTISKDGRRHIRSPPGVFPVRGMGKPLLKEHSIQDSNVLSKFNEDVISLHDDPDDYSDIGHSNGSPFFYSTSNTISTVATNSNSNSNINNNYNNNTTYSGNVISKIKTNTSVSTTYSNKLKRIKTFEKSEANDYEVAGGYNVNENKPSAKLEKMLTRIITRSNSLTNNTDLENQPNTNNTNNNNTQDTFPFNKPDRSHYYRSNSFADSMHNTLMYTKGERRKSFRDVGVTDRAAMMADLAAGVDNDVGFEKTYSRNLSRKTSRHSTQTYITPLSTRSHSFFDNVDINEKNNDENNNKRNSSNKIKSNGHENINENVDNAEARDDQNLNNDSVESKDTEKDSDI